jgi:hypothetical protein
MWLVVRLVLFVNLRSLGAPLNKLLLPKESFFGVDAFK